MSLAPDTIAAIATPPGRGAIGVIRVSGRDLSRVVQALIGRELQPRKAAVVTFLEATGAPIDEGLALYFPSPRSYTGEDVLELHGHGGPTVQRLLLQRCVELEARLAEPGEFTRRAFLNGKLDLAQAESVIDLIDATTAQAARCAVRSLQGEFSVRIRALSASIIELRALVEAALDFPEEDSSIAEHASHQAGLSRITADLDAVLAAARQGSLLREGLHVVLAGEPNVGKSSLLNRLAGKDLAIVTDVPGTTRDLIREVIDLDGIPVHVVDTAGLRQSSDPVERIGIDRAWAAIQDADAVILLEDSSVRSRRIEDDLLRQLPPGIPRVHVMNKIDLRGEKARVETHNGKTMVWISAKTGEGIDLLRASMWRIAGWEGHPEGAFLARERHVSALRKAAAYLRAAGVQGHHPELFAEELRLAHEALMRITGDFTADDLLGEIFSRFCIGK